MSARSTWVGLVLLAFVVAGCGIQGDGSLRAVNAVTLARLPKDKQKNRTGSRSRPRPCSA